MKITLIAILILLTTTTAFAYSYNHDVFNSKRRDEDKSGFGEKEPHNGFGGNNSIEY